MLHQIHIPITKLKDTKQVVPIHLDSHAVLNGEIENFFTSLLMCDLYFVMMTEPSLYFVAKQTLLLKCIISIFKGLIKLFAFQTFTNF